MRIFLKTLTIASVLFGTFATQGNATTVSDNAPKTRQQIMSEKDIAYWQTTGQYYHSARSTTSAVSSAPLTRSEKQYNLSWDYWNKVGYTSTPAKPFNLYTDVSEYPLPHTQLSAARGGYVYAPNAR